MPDKGSPYPSKGTWALYYVKNRRVAFETTGYGLSPNMPS